MLRVRPRKGDGVLFWSLTRKDELRDYHIFPAIGAADAVARVLVDGGTVPAVLRPWHTGHTCAVAGAHLRRDWRRCAPGLAKSAPGLAHICAGTGRQRHMALRQTRT